MYKYTIDGKYEIKNIVENFEDKKEGLFYCLNNKCLTLEEINDFYAKTRHINTLQISNDETPKEKYNLEDFKIVESSEFICTNKFELLKSLLNKYINMSDSDLNNFIFIQENFMIDNPEFNVKESIQKLNNYLLNLDDVIIDCDLKIPNDAEKTLLNNEIWYNKPDLNNMEINKFMLIESGDLDNLNGQIILLEVSNQNQDEIKNSYRFFAYAK